MMISASPIRSVPFLLCTLLLLLNPSLHGEDSSQLSWSPLPAIPDELGVAGPFVGVHNDVLIVAGGANFPRPVWENDKVWHHQIHVLKKTETGYRWLPGGSLPRATAYGMNVSTPAGVVCMGGNDSDEIFDSVFLLAWNPETESLTTTTFPPLPSPCAYGAATVVGNTIYVAGGQSDLALTSAMTNLWSLTLDQNGRPDEAGWKKHPSCPGPGRAFNLTVHQHNGFHDCVYVISGRRQNVLANDEDESESSFEFLRDVWEFEPQSESWRQRSDAPRCVMAGTGISQGQSHILVLGGATEELFFRTEELKDDHPGFIKDSLAYHTITDTWVSTGPIPANHVTTTAVRWNNDIVIPSGEIRPRVRSPNVYRITVQSTSLGFGVLNYLVLFGYLAAMVGVGLYFASRNKTTDDYFRGGRSIPWWAAGCSIFATMLSSLTFTGIPSKSFAQDWVYSIGNFMIPVVAVLAVYVALPFYRRIDATSAYEYLERRFHRSVRLFGSASFTLFHVFRMAIVMSLTGLALAVATPLTPWESVLLMGTLSIVYCTFGGIEAVIWTDTIQTVVLLGGAVVAIAFLISGIDDGVSGFQRMASDADKFRLANFHWDATSSQIALWVIIVGAIAQNTSSYTADQAVVQRYLTTESSRLAAKSIWTNAVLTIPATLLFFGIGTALFAFYRSHPEKLDPTITTDQIFPMFIARELPAGLSGLIVAGIFAAAQSTISTSMNSIATTITTDFIRPLTSTRSDTSFLRIARICTLLAGILGTAIGLLFVDPDIKSLFDTFIKVIGLFMGVLGGLFMLGALTQRANATGALCGAFMGAIVMFALWKFTDVNGYLYTASGITSCFVVGYLTSLLTGAQNGSLEGLTIYGRKPTSAQIHPQN